MPHESTVDHDGSELSADEADSPMSVVVDTAAAAASLHGLLSPGSQAPGLVSPGSQAPHLPHVRPQTPRQVTHHHDDDDDDDDDVDADTDDVADDNNEAVVVVNGSVNN